MAGISADTAVIGVTGISAVGISMGRLEEATETAGMIDVAKRTIVLVDSSKFNVNAFATIAPFERIQHLVTDQQPPRRHHGGTGTLRRPAPGLPRLTPLRPSNSEARYADQTGIRAELCCHDRHVAVGRHRS